MVVYYGKLFYNVIPWISVLGYVHKFRIVFIEAVRKPYVSSTWPNITRCNRLYDLKEYLITEE